MKTVLLLAGIITLAGCGGGSNNPTTQAENANNAKIDSTTSGSGQTQAKNDADFLVFASNVGTFEIQAGKLAGTNSSNKEVKDFAAMMIKDHTQFGNQVSAAAAQKGVTLPTALSNDLQAEYNKLDSLKGKNFDEEYTDANVKGHTEAISKFESVANGNDNSADIKQLAATALPTLREHKQHAEMLQQSLKGKKSSS